jgi:SAM-dependent methyltransferase
VAPLPTSPTEGSRPFYSDFAWAYDDLVDRPVAEECAGMVAMLARRGIAPGATLLDAGCGTGRYAVELARRGFVVTGVDRAPDLLAAARARPAPAGVAVRFEMGDLLAPPPDHLHDAIVCRGVLNDLVEPAARAAVFAAFARAVRPGGALLLDVRDWEASVATKTARPVHERRVTTPRGALVFRSEIRLDHEGHRLLVSERHTLSTGQGETSASFDFVMRCWSRAELDAGLRAAGFRAIEYAAAYEGAAVAVGDRIVAAASLGAG